MTPDTLLNLAERVQKKMCRIIDRSCVGGDFLYANNLALVGRRIPGIPGWRRRTITALELGVIEKIGTLKIAPIDILQARHIANMLARRPNPLMTVLGLVNNVKTHQAQGADVARLLSSLSCGEISIGSWETPMP